MKNRPHSVTHITDSESIDVNLIFKYYKLAVAEFPPKQLSTGKWLHCFRVTPYASYDTFSDGTDPDVECQAYYSEIYG
jgi:hypothetical protein